MTNPTEKKDQAIYHTMLSEMHRLQGILLNLQTLDEQSTAEGLRDHFAREQTLTLGKLAEWRQRRPDIYRQANDDFQHQVQASGEGR
ncbi:MAG TPA: hypothetical protein VF221_23550 [Chloroflexota bacterium]